MVDMDQKIPFIEDSLLEYLQRLFPDKCPDNADTDRQIWINRGRVDVVRHLKHIHSEQRKNILGEI